MKTRIMVAIALAVGMFLGGSSLRPLRVWAQDAETPGRVVYFQRTPQDGQGAKSGNMVIQGNQVVGFSCTADRNGVMQCFIASTR